MFSPDASTRFSPRERRVYVAICAFLVAMLTLPYLWAWLTTPADGWYSGFLYNPDDQNVHLAWARQARDGQFFTRNLFTTEWLQNGEKPLFFNALTLLMGLVSRLTTWSLVVVYHAIRVLAAVACVWFFAHLCAQLTHDKRVRALATALVAFGGGLGWLQGVFPNRTFVDNPNARLTMPEAWTFHSAFVFPLFIVPVALLAFIYWQTLRAIQTQRMRPAIYAGLAALLLANIHTYDVVPLNIVLILWALAGLTSSTRCARETSENKTVRSIAPLVVVAFTLPQIAYQFYVLRHSEEFRVKALSPKIAPPFLDIAFSYAPYLILSIFALWFLYQAARKNEYSLDDFSICEQTRHGAWLMALWVFVTLVCIYTPISFARKMIEGVHLPLCFLAALGFIALLDQMRVAFRLQRVAAGVFVFVMSVSSLGFANWCLSNAVDNNSTGVRANAFMPPLYVLNETRAAMRFLDRLNEPRTRAVLCFPRTGNFVPRESSWPVYVGHFDETLHAARKLDQARRFYSGEMSEQLARSWLKENDIGFVMVGPLEKLVGHRVLDFPVVWREGETTIYRVP